MAEGVLHGGLGLGKGLFNGLTGLVAAPVRGAAEGAAEGKALSGFARGLGKGLVGAAVKPTAGVLGLATKTAEGIRNTKGFLEQQGGGGGASGGGGGLGTGQLASTLPALHAGRNRLPRMLHGAARELRPYDETEALGWRLLGTLARGQYAAEPLLCCVGGPEAGVLLLLTDLRLLCAHALGARPLWHQPLRLVRMVVSADTALLLTLAREPSPSLSRDSSTVRARLHLCMLRRMRPSCANHSRKGHKPQNEACTPHKVRCR